MASSVQPFAAARVRVWATILLSDGTLEQIGNATTGGEIVSASATFALNTIPTASLVMATGFNPLTEKYARIHELKNKLTPRDKVTVYAKIDVGDNDVATTIINVFLNEKIKPGIYKIFEGYLVGIGYQRAQNQANYVLNLVHWLDDLNNSSALNADWLPGAPADLARSALIMAAGVNSAMSIVPTVPMTEITVANVSADLWRNAVTPICTKLASFSSMTKQPAVNTPPPPELKNDAALNALSRMPGDNVTGGANFYVPLSFDFGADLSANAHLNAGLKTYFQTVFGDHTEQNSFWAKIVSQICAEFMFAISPAVDWALPIPYCGGLRAPVDAMAKIAASEYNYADFNTNMSQLLEAVLIAYPIGSGTGLAQEKNSATPTSKIDRVNYYKNFGLWPDLTDPRMSPVMRKRGLKLFKTPPGWIAGISANSLAAFSSTQTSTPYPSATGSTTRPSGVISPAAAYESAKNLMTEFARHWYLSDVLQQRVGELSGILRFDIAPGSLVKIETPVIDRQITQAAGAGADSDYLTATVMSVSYVINSERATAGTSFTFANVRTPAEGRSDLFATDKPPLYKKAFVKAPLSESRLPT